MVKRVREKRVSGFGIWGWVGVIWLSLEIRVGVIEKVILVI